MQPPNKCVAGIASQHELVDLDMTTLSTALSDSVCPHINNINVLEKVVPLFLDDTNSN